MGNRQSLQDERDQRAVSNRLASGLECMTEEQKLKVEGEVDLKNDSVEKVSEKPEQNDSAIVTKAILLNPVIKCIFKYLDLDELKNCRYVCPEWNSVAQPILRSRSIICFPKRTSDGTKLLLSHFYETFSETLESMPFTAFEMNDYTEYTFNHYELDNFFRLQNKTLRELRIGVQYARDCDQVMLESVDVTPWIMESAIAEETKHHTIFAISGGFMFTRVIVQNRALANIKELVLYNCQINIENQIKCRPMILKLKSVAFFKNGIKLADICVNDYFDFSRLKHCELQSSEYHGHSETITNQSLVMKGKLNLERLSLDRIAVVNWRRCSWEMKKLTLKHVDFVEETQMKIQELRLRSNNVDICRLSQSIKKLKFEKFIVGDCFCSQPIIFPNLESLSLNLYENSFSIISEFVQCPNLVTLELTSRGQQVELNSDSDWIPNTITRLKLDNVSINWTAKKVNLNLDKLVVVDHPIFKVKKICSSLDQIKELVVRFPESEPANENIFNLFLARNFFDHWKNIVVGPFHWRNISFEKSSLRHLVDRKAEYYTIENQIIKGFDDSLTFWKHEHIHD